MSSYDTGLFFRIQSIKTIQVIQHLKAIVRTDLHSYYGNSSDSDERGCSNSESTLTPQTHTFNNVACMHDSIITVSHEPRVNSLSHGGEGGRIACRSRSAVLGSWVYVRVYEKRSGRSNLGV